MNRKIKCIIFAIAAALLFGNIGAINVYADEPATPVAGNNQTVPANGSKIVITGIEITDLDEPEVGKPFDTEATVRAFRDGTDIGASWKIPVIWIDESGNTAIIAEYGKAYFPVFVFYIPDGYVLKDTGLSIKGKNIDNLLSVTDPAKGITYFKGKAVIPGSGEPLGRVIEWGRPDNVSAQDAQSSGEDNSSEDEVRDLVSIHCTDSAIAEYDYDFLAWFIGIIRDEIQPKAVNLLCSGLPSFSSAQKDGWFAENIGFCVDVQSGSTIAYVGATSWTGDADEGEDPDQLYLSLKMVYNIKAFASKDSEGKWTIKDEKMTEVESTSVHEMLHAFMYDYNRNGSLGVSSGLEKDKDKYAFPDWFCEGSAEAVSGVYAERIGEFTQYLDDNKIYTGEKLFTEYSDKSKSTSELNGYGAYSVGMLASYYISGLSAQKYNGADFSELYFKDSNLYRNGLDTILSRLNSGQTLDSIINEISRGMYSDTADFEAKFISSADHESTKACVNLLNYFDSIEKASGSTKNISGSMLSTFGEYPEDRLKGVSTDNSVYVISDTKESVISSVDREMAIHTGTKSADNGSAGNIVQMPATATADDQAARVIEAPAPAETVPEATVADEVPTTDEIPVADEMPADITSAVNQNTEPVVTEPVVAEPVVTEPAPVEPVVTEPVAAEPVAAEPVTEESVPSDAGSSDEGSSDETLGEDVPEEDTEDDSENEE